MRRALAFAVLAAGCCLAARPFAQTTPRLFYLDIARGSAFRELLSIIRLHHSLTIGVAISYVAFVLRGFAGLIAKSILPRQLTRRLLLYKNFD